MNLSPNPVISLETLLHKHSMLIIRKLIFIGFWRRKPQNLQQILQTQGCSSQSKSDTCCHGSLCYKVSVGKTRDMSTVFICSIITHSVYFHLMWRKHQKTSLTKHIHSLLNWLKVCGQSHSVNVTFHESTDTSSCAGSGLSMLIGPFS